MGFYWYAVNYKNKTWFETPKERKPFNKGPVFWSNLDNIFPNMFMMMNTQVLMAHCGANYVASEYINDGLYELCTDNYIAPFGNNENVNIFKEFKNITEIVYKIFNEEVIKRRGQESKQSVD